MGFAQSRFFPKATRAKVHPHGNRIRTRLYLECLRGVINFRALAGGAWFIVRPKRLEWEARLSRELRARRPAGAVCAEVLHPHSFCRP